MRNSTTLHKLNENYFNGKLSDIDIDDFTDPYSIMNQVCDNPTHRIVFELNTKFYKSESVDADNNYVRKIPEDVMNMIIYYMDLSSNIYSYGNIRCIVRGCHPLAIYSQVDDSTMDVSDDRNFVAYNDEKFKWMTESDEKYNNHGYVNIKYISVDINAKFSTPGQAVKFIKFFDKIKSRSSSGETEKSVRSIIIFRTPDSEVDNAASLPNYDFEYLEDNAVIDMLCALCQPEMMTKVALSGQSKKTSNAMFCSIIGNQIAGTFENRTDVNPNDYSRVIVWEGFPVKYVVSGRKDKPDTWRERDKLTTEDEYKKIMLIAIDFVKDKHSGRTAYKGDDEETARLKFFLLDDCFIYDRHVYGVYMVEMQMTICYKVKSDRTIIKIVTITFLIFLI